jgi:2-furoate---CoA ligase
VTLGDLFERAALRRPDAEAVVDGPARLTYGQLAERTAALARGFAGQGVGRGDRVLIALKNRLEHVLAYWALQRLGGVPTPVNFRMAANEMAYVLDDSGARMALLEEATRATMLEAARGRDLRLVFVGPSAPAGCVPFEALMQDLGGTVRGPGPRAPHRAPESREDDL